MEIPTLTVEPRKAAGSRAAGRLRNQGKLPAIVYGHGQDPMPISLSIHAVEQHIKHGLHVVNLDVQGQVQPCQFKDAQYDHLGLHLVHLDLVRVDLNERVSVSVPLEFKGTPKGAADGGVFRHEISDLEIECIVSDIPESIRVDISGMALNTVLHVKDVSLPAGITHLMDEDAVVAVVRLPSTAAEPTVPSEDAAAEPEVIAKGKAEEAEDEEK